MPSPSDAYAAARKAAEGGDFAAQCVVGTDLIQGLGVAKDEEQGVKWLMNSGSHGVAEAQNKVAYCFLTGTGVPRGSCPGLHLVPQGG